MTEDEEVVIPVSEAPDDPSDGIVDATDEPIVDDVLPENDPAIEGEAAP